MCRRKVAPVLVYLNVVTLKPCPAQSDEALIRAVLGGNSQAYADIVRRHERIVHAAA
jgi:hypothetical protein